MPSSDNQSNVYTQHIISKGEKQFHKATVWINKSNVYAFDTEFGNNKT